MGISYTPEQQKVIDLRDCNLLVSAAAGSGKTAVLVERIITRLTKDENPINVDELLIVTFTEAAAAEMKERIYLAIEKALKEDPHNAHLQKQATLIHQAQISTIHKFCLNVMKDYFYLIDLDPGYRAVEGGEAKLMMQDAVEKVLEQAYASGDEDFVDFVECFASGKNDQELEKLILSLARMANKYMDPKEWLQMCCDRYDVEKYDYFSEAMQETLKYVEGFCQAADAALGICNEDDGPKGYQDAIQSDLEQLQALQNCATYEILSEAFGKLMFKGLGRNKKDVNPEKVEQVKSLRKYYKDKITSLKGEYFFADVETMKADMQYAKKYVMVLVRLVQDYMAEFALAKKEKNLIDFDDMEHFALQILTKKEGDHYVPSEIAESYQELFAEVMIDEYQDSNYVQEAILSSVSGESKGKYNRFMVGDVKQSIYRFRHSRPELFMEKHKTYSLEGGEAQRIDLHMNFRSRKEVLDSCNFVFEQIMRESFGGVEYDDKAALYVGAKYEQLEDKGTEVLLLDGDGYLAAEQMELEAEMIANYIQELMDTQMVTDKKSGELRKLRYKDITILSRKVKDWNDVVTETFSKYGIPVYCGPKKGYFDTLEVQLILSYLKALDNPMQDIHFAAVLTHFGGFSSEELAIMRARNKKRTMYESLCTYVVDGEEAELKAHCERFLKQFEGLRDHVSYMAIHEFLWMLLQETGYLDSQSVMSGGEQRRANLEQLVEKAITYEGTSYKGLFNFVRYIEHLQQYDDEAGEAPLLEEDADAVSIISIHKSKGLEFPIVFLAGMGRDFNLQDANGAMISHPSLGIAVDAIDADKRVKRPTILKGIVKQRIKDESVSEEIRMLYVAMTRAKEKLIMTGVSAKTEKMEEFFYVLNSHQERKLPYYVIAKSKNYLYWILAAMYRDKGKLPIEMKTLTVEDLVVKEADRMMQGQMKRKILMDWDTDMTYSQEIREQLEEQFSYVYPNDESNGIKQKLSVSELKKRIFEEEEGEEIFKEEEIIPLLPAFMQEQGELTGASRGTAYHKVMELIDFSKEYTEESLASAIREMKETGYLDEQMADVIHVNTVLRFLHSTTGTRLREASRREQCFAEQPFVLGMESNKIYPNVDADEWILIQGIIDMYFEEDGELVVLDYKTDRVSSAQELVERYHAQLDYYATALERLTGKKVKEKLIYSFALHKEISL